MYIVRRILGNYFNIGNCCNDFDIRVQRQIIGWIRSRFKWKYENLWWIPDRVGRFWCYAVGGMLNWMKIWRRKKLFFWMHKQLQCCGSRGYRDWSNLKNPIPVPKSCCKLSECDVEDESQIYNQVILPGCKDRNRSDSKLEITWSDL